VQHNSCNKLGDDECCKSATDNKKVERGGMDLSRPLAAHPPTGHYKIEVTSVRLVDSKEL